MKRRGPLPSPYHLLLFAIPAVIFDFLFLVNPLIFEVLIIRAPFPLTSEFDIWLIDRVFGAFSTDTYLAVLLGTCLVGYLVGFLVSYALLRPIFKSLLNGREVTWAEKGVGARFVIDILAATFIIILGVTPILAYILQYPRPLPSISSGSVLSGYLLTGFITGNVVGKCLFPVQLRLKCKRENLTVKASYLEADSKDRSSSVLIRWALVSELPGPPRPS